MEELDAAYLLLHGGYKADGTVDGQTASERAYRDLATRMQDDFGRNIDWRALQNKRSAWRTGRIHDFEKVADSEDFDAEIDRQFPRK